MMQAPDRIVCCVPFCRRTTRNDKGYSEWICGKHWPLVPRHLKRRKRQAERIAKRGDRPAAWRLAGLIWQRCKREAIERAMGL